MRSVLLCAVAGAIILSFTAASAQEAISTPILTSTPNFRDLAGIAAIYGGTGFVNTTSNGGVMRTGVIYRSDYLSLSNADWQTISTLHIVRDIDLRTPTEMASNQDVVPLGATPTNINIYNLQSPVPSPLWGTPANAVTFMQTGYQQFVTVQDQRNGFRTVMLTIANDPAADLYHCSGGKDRTGWTSAILQTIAGVSQATIMQDYLATNIYTAVLMASTKADILVAHPLWDPETIDALLGVQSSYLQTAFDQVNASYGSMYNYLTEGLGLSQADIYVLRAKMVSYPTLPGQSRMVGNAAAGAAFLNALQDSPLSGHYTAYNYYLQSAIDAGTLGGVETQVGGQVHADAVSFLSRQSQWIDEAVNPYATPAGGESLGEGKTRYWMAGLGGSFESDPSGIADSTEHSAGSIIGATYRINNQASATLGVGANWGSVGSADATATLNTYLTTIGGRYAFSTLESGPYVTARADAGFVDYESKRDLGEGLGTARGDTDGAIFSGLIGLGNRIRLSPFTLTPQTGVRVTHVNLNGFQESGSELALDVKDIDHTDSSLLVDLEVGLDRQPLGTWTLEPTFTLGYERMLDDPQVESTGSLDGFSVSQNAAFDSRNIMKAGFGIAAQHDAFIVKAGIHGLIGDGAKSTGINGELSVGYTF